MPPLGHPSVGLPRVRTELRRLVRLVVLLLATALLASLTAGTASAAGYKFKAPAAPTSAEQTDSTVAVAWKKISKAPVYRVKYSTKSSFASPKYQELTGLSTTLTGLKASTSYYIKVRVVSAKGAHLSAYSSSIRVSTKARSAPNDNPTAGSAPLRVGSYNVRCSSCSGGGPESGTWAERRGAVVSTIEGEDLDVLGVQEASQARLTDTSDNISQFEDLAERLGSPWKLTNSKRHNCVKDTTKTNCDYQDNGASHGTRLLYNSSRVALVDAGSKLLPGPSDDPRYVTWAILEQRSTGRQVLVANSHLAPDTSEYALRRDQAERALATMKANNPDNLPMIALGDWNSGRWDKPSNTPYDVYLDAGLVDPLGATTETSKNPPAATVEKRVNTWLNSFNGFKRQANGHPTWVNGTYIDYIMTTPMRVSEWETVARLDSDGNFVGRIPTDHNLIRATVWLPGRR